MSSASLFQSPDGRVDELVDQDRRASLGQKQERETGRQDLVRLVERTHPEPAELVLFVNQFLGTQAIPVVPAEETHARQPPGTLQAIEIIELPLLAVAEILTDLEVLGQPVDSRLELAVDSPLAAVLDRFALEEFLALKPAQARDDQAGDARAGHAGGLVGGVGRIGPTAVLLLAPFPSMRAPVPTPPA